jgi:histidine phosphotransfer protein HptB
MNISELSENLGLEKNEYLELIDLLIETSKVDIARIRSAVREENSDEAANALHSIKGASGNLGLMDIYDLAKQGEAAARNKDLGQLPDIVHGLKTKIDALTELAGS